MAARDPYFEQLQDALKQADVFQPALVIDLDRLDRNIDQLLCDLPDGMGYRIVAKSLPCPKLIAHIRERTGTDRLMTFNLPMLLSLAADMPDASQLLGKPLPARALRRFLMEALPDAADNVLWLIDTPQRLAEYDAISKDMERPINIVLELDVGLHRGGFEPGADLSDTLSRIHASNRLTFKGYMGYEPHVAAMPTKLGMQDRALKGAWSTYEKALKAATDIFGAAHVDGLTRNAAGSPTFRFYEDLSIANEVSVGSALVKPTHFDTELLAPFEAASFIATPVLKAPGKTRMPGLEFIDGVKPTIDPYSAQTFYIHGGNWLADPVDPPGLSYNKTFGRSSNQEMLNASMEATLAPDDIIFMRPHQSEAIFLQFGSLAICRDGEIVDWWETFPISA